jgi:hypothetical protein
VLLQLTLQLLVIESNSYPAMQFVHYINFVAVLYMHDVQLAGQALQTCVVVLTA